MAGEDQARAQAEDPHIDIDVDLCAHRAVPLAAPQWSIGRGLGGISEGFEHHLAEIPRLGAVAEARPPQWDAVAHAPAGEMFAHRLQFIVTAQDGGRIGGVAANCERALERIVAVAPTADGAAHELMAGRWPDAPAAFQTHDHAIALEITAEAAVTCLQVDPDARLRPRTEIVFAACIQRGGQLHIPLVAGKRPESAGIRREPVIFQDGIVLVSGVDPDQVGEGGAETSTGDGLLVVLATAAGVQQLLIGIAVAMRLHRQLDRSEMQRAVAHRTDRYAILAHAGPDDQTTAPDRIAGEHLHPDAVGGAELAGRSNPRRASRRGQALEAEIPDAIAAGRFGHGLRGGASYRGVGRARARCGGTCAATITGNLTQVAEFGVDLRQLRRNRGRPAGQEAQEGALTIMVDDGVLRAIRGRQAREHAPAGVGDRHRRPAARHLPGIGHTGMIARQDDRLPIRSILREQHRPADGPALPRIGKARQVSFHQP